MNIILKTIHLLLIVLITLFLSAGKVTAVEISITENGSGSTNETSVTQTTETSVEQSNNASVENNVSSTADSGNNEANSNTGGQTTIETGKAENNVNVENSVNQSTATQNCCPHPSTPSSLTITGNGADSTNTTNVSLTQTTTSTVNNNVTITTNTIGVANSGGNKANNNTGDVFIKTGKVLVSETIVNAGINNSSVSFGTSINADLNIKIAGNGHGSVNTINKLERNIIDITINQTANILNKSNWYALSGNNEANGNVGDVSINTGDVAIATIIKNVINTSKVEVTCCENNPQTPPPCTYNCGGENPNPQNPGSPSSGGNGGSGNGGGGGTSSSNGSAGSVAGITTGGDILPATGALWTLWLTILAGLLFALGFYLRMHPGRAPNLKLV